MTFILSDQKTDQKTVGNRPEEMNFAIKFCKFD